MSLSLDSNDENRIVAQLHSIVLRFHNMLADRTARAHPRWSKAHVFAAAQQQVRLHYQWAVLTDFLPSIVDPQIVRAVLPSTDARRAWPQLAFYNPCTMNMPVEFSVAAYRFGHSIVRPIYRINTTVTDLCVVFSPCRAKKQHTKTESTMLPQAKTHLCDAE